MLLHWPGYAGRIEYSIEKKKFLITHYFRIIFSDCNSATDCPNGGTNFDCTTNTCVCQSGLVEDSNDSDACVGM